MPRPYIGITDFTHCRESYLMLGQFMSCGGPASGHLLHVGVMMSRKTLNGIPSKWSNIFPKNHSIASIFIKDTNVLNVLHYADYDGVDEGAQFGKSHAVRR